MLEVLTTCLALANCAPTTLNLTSIPADLPTTVAEAEKRLRKDVLDYAQLYMGLPYRYGGTSPVSGFDCSGFTSYIMAHFKVSISRSSRDQEGQGEKIDLNEAQPGDLLFFRRSANSRVFHVAMVYSNDQDGLKFIHSCCSKGIAIDNLKESSYWSAKSVSARRIVHKADLVSLYGPQIMQVAPAPTATQVVTAQLEEKIEPIGLIAGIETRCFAAVPNR
ncbi:MAG: C40 family peptidase [Haliscomenobacter sp.]|nr:C40 family peptidase [Haliscomenobacter sp.]MBK9491965.1 C40 family peptidase [Haliscomenobacter sp.]